jgi:hypothetical protein
MDVEETVSTENPSPAVTTAPSRSTSAVTPATNRSGQRRDFLSSLPRVDGKSKKVGRGWLVNICVLFVFFQIVGGIGLIDFLSPTDSLFWLSVAQHPIMMIIVHALILAIVIRHCDMLPARKSKR